MAGHAEKAGMIMTFARRLHPNITADMRDASAYTELQIAAAVMQLSMFDPPEGMTHRDVFIRDAGEVFDMVAAAAAETEQPNAPR